MRDVVRRAGQEVVHADDVDFRIKQPLSQVGPEKTGSAGENGALTHFLSPFRCEKGCDWSYVATLLELLYPSEVPAVRLRSRGATCERTVNERCERGTAHGACNRHK